MSFQFIANLILILCVLGILVVFLRRVPEVVDGKGQLQFGPTENEPLTFDFKALSKNILSVVLNFLRRIGQNIWHFMLEAKDLKQSQILASKFANLVRPKQKTLNIGAFNSIKKGDRLYKEGDYQEAEQTYIQVIRKHPHEYSAYEGLLRIYFKQKKYDDVTEILEFLVNNNPSNDSYLAQYGNVLLSTRRFDDAIEAYKKALELNDLVPARFVNLGLAYQATSQLELALPNFQRAVELDPSNIQYLMILVDALQHLDQKQRAVEYLQKAGELHTDNLEIKEKLIELQK